MANKETKFEGPTCACGRVDLYEEWLKQNEAVEKAENSKQANQADNINATEITANKNMKLNK
jgi:hypothetical protein